MKHKVFWALFLLPSSLHATSDRISSQCTTSAILTHIRPGAAWVMQADSLDKLKWLDTKQKKPSKSEVEKARQACIQDETAREAKKARAKLDLKNPAISTDKKVEDLILLLDLDK